MQTQSNWQDWAWRKRVLQDEEKELQLERTILSALVHVTTPVKKLVSEVTTGRRCGHWFA